MVHPGGKFLICGIPLIYSVNLFLFGPGDLEINITACLMGVSNEGTNRKTIIFKPSSHPKRNSKNKLTSIHLSLSSPASPPSKLPSLLRTTVMVSRKTLYYCHQIFHFRFLQCPSFKGIHSLSVELRSDHIS